MDLSDSFFNSTGEFAGAAEDAPKKSSNAVYLQLTLARSGIPKTLLIEITNF